MTLFSRFVLFALAWTCATLCPPTATAQLVGSSSVLPLLSDLQCSPDTLDFGTVVLLDTKTKGATIKDTGKTIATISSVALGNSVDFSFRGTYGPYNLEPDSQQVYFVTFAPQSHSLPNGKHVGNLTFITAQGQKTIYLIGYDHIPLIDTLKFSRSYWGVAGNRLIVTQELVSSPDSTLDSIYNFTETVRYDKNVLDFITVTNGDLLITPDWQISQKYILTPGHVSITAGSSGRALTGKGSLLRLEFHVDNAAKVFDTSYLGLDSCKFSNGFEPVMRVMDGLVRVKDNCNPVFVRSGSPSNSIRQNTPNPVAGTTEISYDIGASETAVSPVRVVLYNSIGEVVRTLVNAEETPGTHSVTLDATSLPNGMYSYTYDCGSRHEVKHLVVAR